MGNDDALPDREWNTIMAAVKKTSLNGKPTKILFEIPKNNPVKTTNHKQRQQTTKNNNNKQQTTKTTPAVMNTKSIRFKPGALGIKYKGNEITYVVKNKQASNLGVSVGWRIRNISGKECKNNADHVTKLLNDANKNLLDYTMIFETSKQDETEKKAEEAAAKKQLMGEEERQKKEEMERQIREAKLRKEEMERQIRQAKLRKEEMDRQIRETELRKEEIERQMREAKLRKEEECKRNDGKPKAG